MLVPETLGVVIAEREYELRDADSGATRPVWLRFGAPVHFPDHGQDYYCPFVIEGVTATVKFFYGGGVDSVQALSSAMINAATMLYTSKPYKEGRLLYLGTADLSLPLATPIAELLRSS